MEQLRGLGLLRRRGRQRTDSLAILTQVQELTRLELVVETLRLARCPAGATASGRLGKDGTLRFAFDEQRCAGCALRPRCCTGQAGRRLTTSRRPAAVVVARARQETQAFKTAYRADWGGVEGCLSALVRGQGVRKNR